jgi:exopolysaccharide biosynthesis polyprenyl glycosylphosphotransferase
LNELGCVEPLFLINFVIRRKYRFLVQLTLVSDVLVLAVSYFAAYKATAIWHSGSLAPFRYYMWVLALIGPFWVVALSRSGLYDFRAYRRARTTISALIKTQLIGGGMLLSAMFLTKSEEVSRLLIQVFIVASGIALVTERLVAQSLLDYRARHRRGSKAWRVLLMSDRLSAAKYQDLLREHPYWIAEIAGTIDPSELKGCDTVNNGDGGNENGSNGKSSGKSWTTILNQFVIDEVLVVGAYHDAPALAELGQACAERGLTFRILSELPAPSVGRYDVEDLGAGRFVISLEVVPLDLPLLVIKRAIDIVSAILGLACCAILYPIYAAWLRRVSPGLVLFRQVRVGRNGRTFILYKFRTMYPDAEQRLKPLLNSNQMSGALFKIKGDPRIIPGGRFMRATHLDEMPQFLNVLRGDMSLVGTRPPTPAEAAQYKNHHHRRLSMRPGITGLWQVKGNRSVKDFEEVVRLDCDYIDNWSLWLDAKLILKTCTEVLKAEGW